MGIGISGQNPIKRDTSLTKPSISRCQNCDQARSARMQRTNQYYLKYSVFLGDSQPDNSAVYQITGHIFARVSVLPVLIINSRRLLKNCFDAHSRSCTVFFFRWRLTQVTPFFCAAVPQIYRYSYTQCPVHVPVGSCLVPRYHHIFTERRENIVTHQSLDQCGYCEVDHDHVPQLGLPAVGLQLLNLVRSYNKLATKFSTRRLYAVITVN